MQEQWRIKELLEWTTRFFADKGMEEPRLEAEVLLARVLEKDRVFLYAHYELPVNAEEREKFRNFIQRRLKGEPSAYIAGHKEFMSLGFKVSPAVLIPRPETELLVEKVLDLAAGKNNLRICDVGTGSGVIAVSLAVYCPAAQIYASDISAAALEIARENALRHQVRVQFAQGDLLAPMQAEENFDIIVANLPYISEEEFQTLEPGVRDYEPAGALLASGDGLDVYRRLLPQASKLLKDDGYLLFEIAPQQSAQALDLVQGFAEAAVIDDLAGRRRLVKARKG